MVEVSLTVGKLDASLALLLTKDHHLIEFPTVLLPNGVNAGSVVTIKCEQDVDQEAEEKKAFEDVQEQILDLFGKNEPKSPVLKIKNVTQTSAVLEWDQLDLGSANIKSLTLFKNSSRLGQIPNPLVNTTTKLSGLPIDTPYEFYLRLDTTAGVYQSETVKLRTHKMTDLSGITVCLGEIDPKEGVTREDIENSLNNMGAKPLQDEVKVDTTHFICTNGLGTQWKKALDSNIPIVRPEWLKASETERRIIGVRNFYLDADPQILEQHRFKKAVPAQSETQPQEEPKKEEQETAKSEEPVVEKENGEAPKSETATAVPATDLEDVPLDSSDQLPKEVEETKEETKEEPIAETKDELREEPKAESPIATKDEAEEPKEEPKETETLGPVSSEPAAEEKVSTSNPEDAEEKAEDKSEEKGEEATANEDPVVSTADDDKTAVEEAPEVPATQTENTETTDEVSKKEESKELPVEESQAIEPPTEELKAVDLNDTKTEEEPVKENGEGENGEDNDDEEDGEDEGEEQAETNGETKDETSKPTDQSGGAGKKKKKNNKKKKGKK